MSWTCNLSESRRCQSLSESLPWHIWTKSEFSLRPAAHCQPMCLGLWTVPPHLAKYTSMSTSGGTLTTWRHPHRMIWDLSEHFWNDFVFRHTFGKSNCGCANLISHVPMFWIVKNGLNLYSWLTMSKFTYFVVWTYIFGASGFILRWCVCLNGKHKFWTDSDTVIWFNDMRPWLQLGTLVASMAIIWELTGVLPVAASL